MIEDSLSAVEPLLGQPPPFPVKLESNTVVTRWRKQVKYFNIWLGGAGITPRSQRHCLLQHEFGYEAMGIF